MRRLTYHLGSTCPEPVATSDGFGADCPGHYSMINIVDGFLMLTRADGTRVAVKGSAIVSMVEGTRLNQTGDRLAVQVHTSAGDVFVVQEDMGEIGAAITRSYKQVTR